MRVAITKPFPFSRDGIRIEQAAAGSVADIPDALVAGLRGEGFVAALADAPAESPAVADSPNDRGLVLPPHGSEPPAEAPAGDADADGIPDDLERLPWFTVQKLVQQRTGSKPKTKAEAVELLRLARG